jgi:Integrase core domain
MDLLPALPMSSEGYNHLLIIVDYFSKWIELIPLRTKTSVEVAYALDLAILSRFGLPVEFRSDNGREFMGEVSALCARLDIQLHRTSVANP